MYTAENISFIAGKRQILRPMSFSIAAGSLTVLLGPNGAGKSTLLRLLSGSAHSPTGGIKLDHRPLPAYRAADLARKRAVLTQHYAVSLPFTCREIVEMGRYPHEGTATKAEHARVVDQCMDEMEVACFADRLFHTLSGGEQQRVQMARVWAQLESGGHQRDKALLLDEPTASLDYLQQQQVMFRAAELAKRGYTVVVVLHDLNLAAQYADTILLLKEGDLLAKGPAAEVLQPGLLQQAFGLPVDLIRHEDYPFPILVPAKVKHNPIVQIKKTQNHGTYSNTALVTRRVASFPEGKSQSAHS